MNTAQRKGPVLDPEVAALLDAARQQLDSEKASSPRGVAYERRERAKRPLQVKLGVAAYIYMLAAALWVGGLVYVFTLPAPPSLLQLAATQIGPMGCIFVAEFFRKRERS